MIGTDIVAIARMQQVYDRYPQKVVRKILHPAEYEECNRKDDIPRFLAKRWAVKEAVSKAIGTGLRAPITMPAIGIAHDQAGAPQVYFDEKAQQFLQSRGVSKVSVSVSDEKDYVVAFALVSY